LEGVVTIWCGKRRDEESAQRRSCEKRSFPVSQLANNSPKPLGTIWLDFEPYSVATVGLKQSLEERARVHVGQAEPSDPLSLIILYSEGIEDVSERVRRAKETHPETPILVFRPDVDLSVARAALQAGARGFIHGGMRPKQVIRAIEIATKGEMVAPRQLLEHVIEHLSSSEEEVDLNVLSSRQQQILGMVVEGMSNAEIGKRLHLSESTIKQHLRTAYKTLGVSNRTQASKLLGRQLNI
jgi:DNA-binding NarL/FixJ family response regulator